MLLQRRTVLQLLLSSAASAAAQGATPHAGRDCDGDAAAIDALTAEIERRAELDLFSGTVLVARDGRPIFHRAYGWAERERAIATTLRTRLIFASMGKMFTGVAVAQLAEAGIVRFDDPLGNYLPDYPSNDLAAVTIHQLLTHTGGAGNTFGPEFDAHRLELQELQDYIELFGARGLQSPVGQWVYSNYGYILLGRVIEVVSGKRYHEYVRDHVFRPAKMRWAGNEPSDTHVPRLATPYTRQDDSGTLQSAENRLPYRGTSAGGGYATVEDFLKFSQVLLTHRLLSPESTELVTAGKVNTLGRVKYGYGFMDHTTPDGVRSIGHNGGAPGINGDLAIYPASGYVVVALANLDVPAASAITQFIGREFPVGVPRIALR